MSAPVSGIIPPLVTPMNSYLEFDERAFTKLIEHVLSGGVHGIFILGTNGECASLSRDIRLEAIDTAVRTSAGRVPVFVNISTSSYLETMQLADYSAASGADFLVLSPPYYFSMDQDELYRYFETVASKATLPLFLYNAPQYTKNEITPATVTRLESHPNIKGIKDSSGNMEYIQELIDRRKDKNFSILIGYELILGKCLLLGCNGGVCGGGNIFPKLYVNMYDSATQGNLDEMEKWQSIIHKVYNKIYEIHDSPMGIIIGLKYALSKKSICLGNMAMPIYDDYSESQKDIMNSFLEETVKYNI